MTNKNAKIAAEDKAAVTNVDMASTQDAEKIVITGVDMAASHDEEILHVAADELKEKLEVLSEKFNESAKAINLLAQTLNTSMQVAQSLLGEGMRAIVADHGNLDAVPDDVLAANARLAFRQAEIFVAITNVKYNDINESGQMLNRLYAVDRALLTGIVVTDTDAV